MNNSSSIVTILSKACFALLIVLGQDCFGQLQQYQDIIATKPFRNRDVLNISTMIDLGKDSTLATASIKVTDFKGLSPEDRELIVVIYIGNVNSVGQRTSYRVPITLPEGSTTVTKEISLHCSTQFTWDVKVFEENTDIEAKRRLRAGEQDYQWAYNSSQGLPIALVLSTADDATTLAHLTPIQNINMGKVLFNGAQIVYTNNVPTAAVAPAGALKPKVTLPSEAPESWLLYFRYDVVYSSLAALEDLVARYPKRAEAIRSYVMAGGSLFIYDAIESDAIKRITQFMTPDAAIPKDWRKLSQTASPWWIEKSTNNSIQTGLGIPQPISVNQLPAATYQAQAIPNQVQAVPNSKQADKPKLKPLTLRGLLADSAVLLETALAPKQFEYWYLQEVGDLIGLPVGNVGSTPFNRQALLAPFSTDSLKVANFGFGSVTVCLRPPAEVDPTLLQIERSTTSTPIMVSQQSDGGWFWRNIITAVGKPPVWFFCALVGLFCLLLGPGLLSFTALVKRRSLMIFFVPVFSILATISIISYGVFHEGFENYARVTSVVNYQVDSKMAFGWSRQNYFCGTPSREGLKFAPDTYVRMVFDADRAISRSYDPHGSGAVFSVGEETRLFNWLKPRQHQQLLIGGRVDFNTVPISIRKASGDSISVKNLTSMKLPLIVLRGKDKSYYVIEGLDPGTELEVAPQTLGDVTALTSRVSKDFQPKIPDELTMGSGSLLQFGRSRYYPSANYAVTEIDVVSRAFADSFTEQLNLPEYGFAALMPSTNGIELPLKAKVVNELCIARGVSPW